jgi:hypothetical protein
VRKPRPPVEEFEEVEEVIELDEEDFEPTAPPVPKRPKPGKKPALKKAQKRRSNGSGFGKVLVILAAVLLGAGLAAGLGYGVILLVRNLEISRDRFAWLHPESEVVLIADPAAIWDAPSFAPFRNSEFGKKFADGMAQEGAKWRAWSWERAAASRQRISVSSACASNLASKRRCRACQRKLISLTPSIGMPARGKRHLHRVPSCWCQAI